jgi:hypothetical protein
VTGALALAWWSGTLTWATFRDSLLSATRLSGMIMLILSGAAFTTAAMAYPAFRRRWRAGWKRAALPLRADRGPYGHVHHPRCLIDGHLDDRPETSWCCR